MEWLMGDHPGSALAGVKAGVLRSDLDLFQRRTLCTYGQGQEGAGPLTF